jgi:peroxiredoxin
MSIPKALAFLLFSSSVLTLLSSCNEEFKNDNYTAYFGGEVSNPTNRYILFCKDAEVIDTIPLKQDNTFLFKFDSLAPGLYSFKHEPEYQYVYFDKNDSIMVQMNSKNFDESIVFCGRGDQKNNFLMETYLKNEEDKNQMFTTFDYEFDKFSKLIDDSYKLSNQFYSSQKEKIKWSDSFDTYAKAMIDFHYYSKKEIYPSIHKVRTGEDDFDKLPKDYYAFRQKIDFNNPDLATFSPFIVYLTNLLSNVSEIKYHNHYNEHDKALKTNINKLTIADTLIKNKKIKNTIFNNIAFNYLLEDQNMVNNEAFLQVYSKYSTDKETKGEILKIGQAIYLLKSGNTFPNVNLIDVNGHTTSSNALLQKKTVVFFYTKNAETHMVAAHKKAIAFQAVHPDYQFLAINLDKDQSKWKELLSNYNFNGIKEYRCTNFDDLRLKWAITKINRTIVLDQNGRINNAFTNLFEAQFEKNLK